MTRKERILLAIELGFTYNPETGKVYGIYGKEITGKLNGYIKIQIKSNNKLYDLFAHQFAWYWVNNEIVDCLDHINGIKTDNRICNLRSVTNQQNQWNQTNAKGYYWCKVNNKWCAQIRLNGKQINLGHFNYEEKARVAYLEAKEKYHIITK
jgi:hypothetical protein